MSEDGRARSPSAPIPIVEDRPRVFDQELFDRLRENEKRVLCARFALEGGKPKTLRQTGDDVGLGPERIRQIQNSALRKLKRWMERKEIYGVTAT